MRSIARMNRILDELLAERRELRKRVSRLEQAFAVAFPGRYQIQQSLDDAGAR